MNPVSNSLRSAFSAGECEGSVHLPQENRGLASCPKLTTIMCGTEVWLLAAGVRAMAKQLITSSCGRSHRAGWQLFMFPTTSIPHCI